jgi:hypothetical protein
MACDGHEVSAAFEEEVDVVWRAVEHLLLRCGPVTRCLLAEPLGHNRREIGLCGSPSI